jgi:A/G-specific adenine glycosylase
MLGMTQDASARLLQWYQTNARHLPWRDKTDPYSVWVSEIMLQQTRVETVIDYFRRWMERFPNLQVLASADRQEVLVLWEGLGYYRRAHNLHQAAKILVEQYGGRMPTSPDELRQLPGIGKYTAAAIAAIAYGQDVIALDGNLRRVIARLIDLEVDPRSSKGESLLRSWAEGALPQGKASEFNQALMDLGATICIPKSPRCQDCPLQTDCLAYANGTQAERPLKAPRKKTPHYTIAAAVIQDQDKVLLGLRPETDLLGGLWEFPGGKVEEGETLLQALKREIEEELAVAVKPGEEIGVYPHAYTHFRITLHAFETNLQSGEPQPLDHDQVEWVRIDQLDKYPMGKVDRLIAEELQRRWKSNEKE